MWRGGLCPGRGERPDFPGRVPPLEIRHGGAQAETIAWAIHRAAVKVGNQSASAEITSPRPRVERARQVGRDTVSLMNATCPSQKSALTPPGWLLRAVFHAGLCGGLVCQQSNVFAFGVR